MCLGLPMQIVEIQGYLARCEAKGVQRDVNLLMLEHETLRAGDHVLVHLGFALEKLDPDDARDRWAALDEALAIDGAVTTGGRDA